MKGYFKSLKTVVKVNSSGGFECPYCLLSESQAPARLHLMNDKVFKKYKFYTRMSQKNTQSLAGYMNGSNSLY